MTKEITKAFILQQIQDKFKLRECEPDIFTFSEQVIPVYNIEQHLKTWELLSESVSITSATNFLFATVPPDEKWLLRGYMMLFYSEGAYQISGLYINKRPASGTIIYLDLKKNQATSYIVNLPVPVELEPGNELNVLVDTYVSTANLKVVFDIQKETIR